MVPNLEGRARGKEPPNHAPCVVIAKGTNSEALKDWLVQSFYQSYFYENNPQF